MQALITNVVIETTSNQINMKIMKPITVLAFATILACQQASAADYAAMSKGSGVPQAALATYCKKIDCKYDKLKDSIQATASDNGGKLLVALSAGLENRTLQFSWVSGTESILVTAYHVFYTQGWDSTDSAEIYVGKEMVAKLNSSVDSHINSPAKSSVDRTEKVETVDGSISIVQAEKIASASPKDITIRFYSKNGYTDKEGLRPHKMLDLVELAKAR